LFNLTDHFDKDDWDSQDWDDMDWAKIVQQLFLWPDQCVGVGPRCYSLTDESIFNVVNPLFAKTGIPEGTTHVQVNCQADAWMLSRTINSFADGFQKSMPTLIAWITTVVLLSTVALAFSIYGCVRLCHRGSREVRSLEEVPLAAQYKYHAIHEDDKFTEMTYPQTTAKAFKK